MHMETKQNKSKQTNQNKRTKKARSKQYKLKSFNQLTRKSSIILYKQNKSKQSKTTIETISTELYSQYTEQVPFVNRQTNKLSKNKTDIGDV